MNLTELLATLEAPIVVRPTRRMTQGELESYLDKAADILRGNADHSEFRGYVFALLFFKRINDCYEEEVRTQTDTLIKASVPVDQALQLARDPQNHHFIGPRGGGLEHSRPHRQGPARPGAQRGNALHRASQRPPAEQFRRHSHRQNRFQQAG
jgi:type I restriction enzyme M protein